MRAVPLVECEVVLGFELVAEHFRPPAQGAYMGLGVWVKQQFVRVETMAVLRIVWAVNAIAVNRPRARVGEISVPDLVGIFGQFDASDFLAAVRLEQAELDLGS